MVEKKGQIESEDVADSLFREVLANFLVLMFMAGLLLLGIALV